MDTGRVKRIQLDLVNPGTKISYLELKRLLDAYPSNSNHDMITECSEKHVDIHHISDVPGGLLGLDHLLLFHLECKKCQQDPTFCSWCQHLRLRHLIVCEAWRVGRIYLGHIRDIAARHACSFCSFITQAIKRTWEAAGFHDDLSTVDKTLACHIQLDHYPGVPYLLLSIDSHYPPEFPKRNRGQDFWLRAEAQILFQSPQGYVSLPPNYSDPYPLFSGKRRYQEPGVKKDLQAKNTVKGEIDGATSSSSSDPGIETTPSVGAEANWGIIKDWIHTCEGQHAGSCDVHNSSINLYTTNVFVIDVNDRCVVLAPSDCRYIALSYVWGVPKLDQKRLTATLANIEDLKKHGALSSALLPRTINDAICVCKELGERYLWVDSLCIIQDDLEQKQRFINSMTAIFSMAVFTIIAASGSDADAGLPGTKDTLRPVQSKIVMQDLVLTCILPDIYDTVFSSTWNGRGWTYQEQWLSPRRLYFSPFQIFFVCNKGSVFCEDICAWRKSPLNRAVTVASVLGEQPYTHASSPFKEYVDHVEAYTKRALTFPSDFLNAFSGITGLLLAKDESFSSFLFGLPEGYFEHALLWSPRNISSKKDSECGHEFPTWSWAYNVDQVHYFNPAEWLWETDWNGKSWQILSIVEDWKISNGKDLLPIQLTGTHSLGQEDTRKLSQPSSTTTKTWLSNLFSTRTPPSTSPESLALSAPGRLLFQSSCIPASLRNKGPLSFTDTELWIEPARLFSFPFRVTCSIPLEDAALRYVSDVFPRMPGYTQLDIWLVAISAGKYVSKEGKSKIVVNAMMVQVKEGIGRRVGICVLPMEEWRRGAPEVRRVVLE